MAAGPGKYDAECNAAMEQTQAEGVILLVFHGRFGSGFSAHLPTELLLNLPDILRKLADDVERDLPNTLRPFAN